MRLQCYSELLPARGRIYSSAESFLGKGRAFASQASSYWLTERPEGEGKQKSPAAVSRNMLTAPRGVKINQETPLFLRLLHLTLFHHLPPHLVNIQPHRELNLPILFTLDFPSTADVTQGGGGGIDTKHFRSFHKAHYPFTASCNVAGINEIWLHSNFREYREFCLVFCCIISRHQTQSLPACINCTKKTNFL